MDEIYINTPAWLDHLFQEVETEVILDLEKYSEYFKGLRKTITGICDECPDFIAIVENHGEQKPLNLSEEKVRKLAKLYRAEIEREEFLKRIFYCRGCRDGVKYAEYEGITKS